MFSDQPVPGQPDPLHDVIPSLGAVDMSKNGHKILLAFMLLALSLGLLGESQKVVDIKTLEDSIDKLSAEDLARLRNEVLQRLGLVAEAISGKEVINLFTTDESTDHDVYVDYVTLQVMGRGIDINQFTALEDFLSTLGIANLSELNLEQGPASVILDKDLNFVADITPDKEGTTIKFYMRLENGLELNVLFVRFYDYGGFHSIAPANSNGSGVSRTGEDPVLRIRASRG